jgi:hypothetical protein
MRLVLLISCLALLSASGVAADSATPAPAAPAAAPSAQAVNTICPISGEAVDPSVPTIAGKTSDGKTVAIGMCCSKCAAVVAKNPDAYADAAVANQKASAK